MVRDVVGDWWEGLEVYYHDSPGLFPFSSDAIVEFAKIATVLLVGAMILAQVGEATSRWLEWDEFVKEVEAWEWARPVTCWLTWDEYHEYQTRVTA